MGDIRAVIFGLPNTPIFELGERLSSFYDYDYITIEQDPSDGLDSYFEDKIPAQYLDTGDFISGSQSQGMDRDPLSLRKEHNLDELTIPDNEELSAEEIDSIYIETNGFISSEIPDRRLVGWATHVIVLNADTNLAIEWFASRRKCYSCGAVYHLEDRPSRVLGICDRCGSDLRKKPEDLPDVVRERYARWRKSFNKIREDCKEHSNFLQLRIDQLKDFEDIVVQADRWFRKTSKELYRPDWQYTRNTFEY